MNGPTFPPVQAQKISTATPLAVSNPIPPTVTVKPCWTTVATLATAIPGSVLSGEIGVELMAVMLGRPSAGLPWSSANTLLEVA